MNLKKEKGKIGLISLLAISIALTITMAYAPPSSPGYLLWYNPDTSSWEPVGPSPNHLDLEPAMLPIELKICGIPSDLWGKTIQVKVSNEADWLYTAKRIRLVNMDGCIDPFDWPISEFPDYTICETNVVQYREIEMDNGYDTGNVFVVDGVMDAPFKNAHIHIIPEFAFGTVMSILSLLSGLGVYSKFRKR